MFWKKKKKKNVCFKCRKEMTDEETKILYVRDFREDKEGLRNRSVLCLECFEEEMEKIDAMKSCDKCAHFRVHVNEDGFFDINKPYCKKLDIDLETGMIVWEEGDIVSRRLYFEAEQCVHFISEKEYKKKALRGEITKEHEAYFVVCEYCGTRYDANKYSRCPNCGSTRRNS